MDTFTITCGSCRSRIRVRNPNLIGQAVNCPKCNAQVTVTAPQQIRVEPLGASAADSMTETKIGIPLLEQDFSDFAPLEAPFRYDEPLPPVSLEAAVEPTAVPPIPTAPLSSAKSNAKSPAAPQEGKHKQILLVSGIATAGLVLAALGFYGFLRWQGSSSSKDKQVAIKDQNDSGSKSDVTGNAGSDITAQPADNSSSTDKESDPTKGKDENSDKISLSEPGSLLDGTPVKPSDSSTSTTSTSSPTNSDKQTEPAPTDNKPAVDITPNPNMVTPTDLVNANDPKLTTEPNSATSDKGTDEQAAKPAVDLPPSLQSFADLLGRSFEPVITDSNLTPSPPPPTAQDAGSANSNDSRAELPATLDKQLATSITGMAIQDRTLCDVTAALSVAADLPICIDFDSLRAGQFDRSKKISLRATKEQTVESLLNTLAESSGFELAPIANMLLLAQGRAADIEKLVPTEITVSDLVQGAEQEAWLIAAIKALLPELQGDLELKSGKLTSGTAASNRLLWFQVVRLIESWRAKRTGSAPADAYIASIVQSDWPEEQVRSKLQLQLKEITTNDRPIVLSLVRACREAKLECWVDWPNTVAVDWTPLRSMVTMTDKRSLKQLLDLFSSSLGVVIAAEDENTLWVTTPFAHRRQPRLYVVPRGSKTMEEWQKELAPLAPYAVDGTKELQVIASPDQQHVFLRCCRPVVVP